MGMQQESRNMLIQQDTAACMNLSFNAGLQTMHIIQAA